MVHQVPSITILILSPQYTPILFLTLSQPLPDPDPIPDPNDIGFIRLIGAKLLVRACEWLEERANDPEESRARVC